MTVSGSCHVTFHAPGPTAGHACCFYVAFLAILDMSKMKKFLIAMLQRKHS